MAAFERISKLHYVPQGLEEAIDIGRIRLPSRRLSNTYNPLEHRDPENPIANWMAYVNLMRTLFGPGMLVMPLAISQAGIVFGPLLTLFTGFLLIHTQLILLNTLTEISRQLKIPHISYRYGFRLALLHGPSIFHGIGRNGPQIIAIFMFLSQLGICTVFVILSMDSVRDIFDWQSNEPALLVLLVPYMVLEFCMHNLRVITYVCFVGGLLNLVGLILIFYYIIYEPNGEVVTTATNLHSLLLSFGASLFNLSAVGVILSLDQKIKDPTVMTRRFGVITVGVCVPTVVSVIFGTCGYWAFGTMEENVLRSLPLDEVTSIIVLTLYLISVAFAYPIQCHPAIGVILEVLKYHDPVTVPSEKTLKMVKIISRPVFVLFTFFICYMIPFQGPFVAFVGNLCTSMLSLVFPVIMDLCMRYPNDYGPYDIYLIKNVLIIFLGTIDWFFGAIFVGYVIYVRMRTNDSPIDHEYY